MINVYRCFFIATLVPQNDPVQFPKMLNILPKQIASTTKQDTSLATIRISFPRATAFSSEEGYSRFVDQSRPPANRDKEETIKPA